MRGTRKTMGQYRLWLHHREIDQYLRGQQIINEQELAGIDERIARIEKTAMQTSNALLNALMQQLHIQEHTTPKITEISGVQSEFNAIRQESTNSQIYQTPPASNYEQQGISVFPPLSVWSQLLNLNAQETSLPNNQMLSAETVPVQPEETHPQSANQFNTLFRQEPQKNVQPPLPWWLRDLTQNTNEEQETQEMESVDQQSTPTNPLEERSVVRRTRLIHYIQKPQSQS